MRFLLACVAALACGTISAAPPNVVVILADDMGWGDLSLNGNTNLRTPHLDSLATGGAKFEHFFVQPVCSPTRAEFLTGRYHPRVGVRDVSTGGERINLDEKTIADSFRAAGYKTACFGKWHNGSQYPYHPNGRGFDEFYGFTSGHWGDYFSPTLEHNGRTVKGNAFLADDITDRAIGFIDANKAKPFFCYLAFNTPHSPMQVPDKYWDRFKNKELALKGIGKEDIAHTRAALAMCENLDDNVGRVLKALDDQKLANNTIVMFFNDNGPNGGRWNGGMKGRKGSTDEGGVRSPLLVRWTGTIKPGTVEQTIAGAIDLMPTLCELAGVKHVGEKRLDGESFAQRLKSGESANFGARRLVQLWNGRVSVRTQSHRLDAERNMFDMTRDPGQQNDLSAGNAELAEKLSKWAAFMRDHLLGDLPKKDDRPFPVGYIVFPVTTLPARDGVPHGNVRRSARAPNCSYFTNWTTTDDRITWDVDVNTAGKYRVEVLYTCAKENVGATVELSLGAAKLSAKVTDAHDPKPYGAENDRVPRVGESLMKDFKPWAMGEVALPKGRGSLALRATDISGKGVIEVRAVVLTLLE